MSLEAAAKELERLETRMQKRLNEKSSTNKSGGEDEKEWREGTTDAGRVQQSDRNQKPPIKPAEGKQRHGGTVQGESLTVVDGSDDGLLFESSYFGPGSAGGRREEASGGLRSPTRVHLRRTGSVEIERGVGYPLEHQSSRLSSNDPTQGNDLSATATAAAASRDEGNSAADSGNNSVRFNRFGHGSSKDAAGTGDRQHTTRDARWRASDLDDVGSGRSFPSAWASYGSAGAGAGVELPRKGWRTEADADLSDIKATMRRIDGTSGFANGTWSGSAFAAAGGGTFGSETATSMHASSAALASAAIRFGATDSATIMDRRDGLRSSNPAISGIRDGVHSSIPALSGVRGTSGLYTSVGGESARALGWGASTGSKAVLSALRALQDKIRKLESERDRAAVEAGTLRRQIAALQAENERSAQVNLAGEQETRLASRLAYERLQADKNAADIRLRKAEQQRGVLGRELEAAKERSQKAEAARRAAESRVSTLEDRLLGLGRREDADASAEIRRDEQAIRGRQETNGQVEVLKTKVAAIEDSISAERSLRLEAQDGLVQALSAKGATERYLQEVLQVNEELVRWTTAGGAAPAAGKNLKKLKRPGAKAAGDGRRRSKVPAAEQMRPPTPPPLPPPPHGGFVDSREFNVGSHTAKRAQNRIREVRQTKRRPTTSSANAAPCIACETDPYRTKPGSTTASQRKLASTVSTAKAAAAAAAAVATRRATQSSSGVVRNNRRKAPAGSVGAGGGLARRGAVEGLGVPFIGSGTGLESYNVVSAVSKAVRSARRGRPRESLDTLYADVGAAVLDSTGDVPFMFNRRYSSRQPRQLHLPKPPRRTKNVAGKKVSSGSQRVKVTKRGRAVLDVAMPDLGSLNLGSEPDDRGQRLQHANNAGSSCGGDGGANTSAAEYYSGRWDEAAGQDRRGGARRHETGQVRRTMRTMGTGMETRRAFEARRSLDHDAEERDEDEDEEDEDEDEEKIRGGGGYGENDEGKGFQNGARTGSRADPREGKDCDIEAKNVRGQRKHSYGADDAGVEGDGFDEGTGTEADERGHDSGYGDADGQQGEEGAGVGELPTTDDSLSSGDEKAWQDLANRP